MKIPKIAKAMGYIDDTLISDAADCAKTAPKNNWLKRGALAACFIFLVCAGIRLIPNQPSTDHLLPDQPSDDHLPPLPTLTISEHFNKAMGYEGYMAYDISELADANPWNEESGLSSLPVFQNPLSYDNNYTVSGGDFKAIEAFLLAIADRLGLNTENLAIRNDTPDADTQAVITEKLDGDVPEGYFNPTKLIAEQEGTTIEVHLSGTATITFDPAVSLPENYNFNYYSSYEDTYAAAEYFEKTYQTLLSMPQPRISISGGDYNIYLQQAYHIAFYNAAGNLTEQILNYNFNQAAFYCNEEGKLYMIRIYHPDLSEKTGEYPIISAEKAKELLLKGNYITTVPYEMPGSEYIAKTELIYRTGVYETYYMPYYRFYVELPEAEREHGLKDYGAYYVPAVQEAYITNMPVWDGGFNE